MGEYGGSCSSMDFSGVTDVYSADSAFMALNKNTGAAHCWGHPEYGGSCRNCWGHWNSNSGGRCSSMDFSGVTDVYSTTYSFMALNKNTGAAQCWGHPEYGGSCSSMDFSG